MRNNDHHHHSVTFEKMVVVTSEFSVACLFLVKGRLPSKLQTSVETFNFYGYKRSISSCDFVRMRRSLKLLSGVLVVIVEKKVQFARRGTLFSQVGRNKKC